MKYFYLIAAIVGTILPLSHVFQWINNNEGFDIIVFYLALTSNHISLFAWLNVLISVLVLIPFIIVEAKRNSIRYYGTAILLSLLAGVSAGLPIFLFLREVYAVDRKRSY